MIINGETEQRREKRTENVVQLKEERGGTTKEMGSR